ncbi:MAG TPA: pitrilysin family protein [Flavisolibacter sp.]|jgi:predicted Zn-dependent peptidase|nr:pitrilysin family protein [Flavisolibacter sp.]
MIQTLNRTQPPPIKNAVELELRLKPCEKAMLDNGAGVYAVNAGAEDVLLVEWVYYAGNWYEEKNLVAATTNFLLKNGTTNKTAFQLNEHFEYHGSYLNRNCYNETATITLHCLSKHLEALLPVVREMILESVFPEEELNTYKQNMQQRLRVNMRKSDFVAGRLIDTYLYGEHHPYGRYTRFEDFEALSGEEIRHFYREYYQKGKFVIFTAGKLPANIVDLLNRHFGDLPINAVNIPVIRSTPAAEKKYRVTNDPQGVQGAIRMGANFPNRHHPDFVKVQVLNNVFGGFFGSRLMSNIREEKGYTYGIHSYLENHIQESAWVISTEAGRDVCEPAIVEVYKEMERLRNEPVDEEELLLVRNYMMGSILGDLDGPFQIINRWKNLVLNGLDESFFTTQLETIRTIPAEELQKLANSYLQPENFYELVVV